MRRRGLREAPEDRQERALTALFQNVVDPEPLTGKELAAVRRRLGQSNGSGRQRARELVLVLAALLSGVGVAFGGVGLVEWARESAAESRASNEAATEGRPARASARRNRPAPRATAAPVEEAVPLEASAAPTARSSALPSESRRADAPPPSARSVSPTLSQPTPSVSSRSAGALSEEAATLSRALTALRREGDARRAIALLDEYESEYPSGALLMEAKVTRVHALLALGDTARAERVLESLPLDGGSSSAELRLLRAELRARRDCPGALRELDALVAAVPATLAERALAARAQCRSRTGDADGAARDARAYLDRAPNGRFAPEARAILARPTSPGAAVRER